MFSAELLGSRQRWNCRAESWVRQSSWPRLGRGCGFGKETRLQRVTATARSEFLIEVGAIRGPEMNYHLSRFPNLDDYAVIIEFSHAPRDASFQ
jgi:hypothetical protein